jgi:hypothetical protein
MLKKYETVEVLNSKQRKLSRYLFARVPACGAGGRRFKPWL